ncbi:hypothetical protein GOP47_0008179 [Adiantum capillus-veneris]|uniref:Uncharacterized protein n=1 Tax=Adiantum capillus-veneris TaxID=13818 RepID=A0A9D4UY21_ADICA|nr:hypothetical protein GOP47_0008179 [Adiantum capillus-veneris]
MANIMVRGAPSKEETTLEWVKLVSAELSVCVHPAWSNNVFRGVQESLNSLLFRYNEDLDGVVLAYLDLKIPSSKAKILCGLSPYFRVNLTAKLLCFSPKMGMLLEGKVNKIAEDYIGVLVLGLFNAAIGVSDIRNGFHYLEEVAHRSWVNKSEKHVIKLDSIIRFSVKSVEEKDEFLDLSGSLMSGETEVKETVHELIRWTLYLSWHCTLEPISWNFTKVQVPVLNRSDQIA